MCSGSVVVKKCLNTNLLYVKKCFVKQVKTKSEAVCLVKNALLILIWEFTNQISSVAMCRTVVVPKNTKCPSSSAAPYIQLCDVRHERSVFALSEEQDTTDMDSC